MFPYHTSYIKRVGATLAPRKRVAHRPEHGAATFPRSVIPERFFERFSIPLSIHDSPKERCDVLEMTLCISRIRALLWDEASLKGRPFKKGIDFTVCDYLP